MVEILPSILSADFARLQWDIERVERAGVSMLHLDIMDGHFVPNISFGPPVIAAVRAMTQLKLDVHLMIEKPERYIHDFVRAGADSISVHQEACRHLDSTIRAIQAEGRPAGVVINPSTPVSVLDDVIEIVDYVLVMSVNPGFGGQQFIPRMLRKVLQLEQRRRDLGLRFPIQIDGGITLANVAQVVQAGCEWIVAGSSIFGVGDPEDAARAMRKVAESATLVRV